MTEFDKNTELEKIIMNAVKPVLRELRMIDVTDFISYLHFDQHYHITDIFVSACEQYFAPDFFAYREVGIACVDWGKAPTIELEVVMNTPSVPVEFALVLGADTASVRLRHTYNLDCDNQDGDRNEALRRSILTNTLS